MTVHELHPQGVPLTERQPVKLGVRLSQDRKFVEVCTVDGDATSVVGISPDVADEMSALLRSLSLEIRNGGRQGS